MGKGQRLIGEVLIGGNEGGGAKEGTRGRQLRALEPAKGVNPRLLNLRLAASGPRNRLQAGLAPQLLAGGRRVICFGCQALRRPHG